MYLSITAFTISASSPVATNTKDQTQVEYNPNKPFDDSFQKSIKYEIKNKPVFAGCMKANGRYKAYTQQGTVLNDVSQSDCERLIEKGERPFDYFSDRKQEQMQASDNTEKQLPVIPDDRKSQTMYENANGI